MYLIILLHFVRITAVNNAANMQKCKLHFALRDSFTVAPTQHFS